MTTHTDLAAQEEPSDSAIKLAEMILSDCGHSTAITTRLRDRVALRIDKYTAALESQPDAAQGVPEGWHTQAAMWLREKAAKRDETCDASPEHDKAYPAWRMFARKFRMLAFELEALADKSRPAEAKGEQVPKVSGFCVNQHGGAVTVFFGKVLTSAEVKAVQSAMLAATPKPQEQAAQVVAVPGGESELERLQGENDEIVRLNHAQWLALENVRHLAARNRKEDWAQHLLRWCAEAGNAHRILRTPTEATTPQPASEPVAWVRRHPDGALTAEFLEHAVIEPVRKKSGAWVPLYATPQPAAKAAQAERVALKPLTVDQMHDEVGHLDANRRNLFACGVRFAEKCHGITAPAGGEVGK